MSDTSPNLDLPFLLPAQAQKHVTHNEALERLDLFVQLTVQRFDAETPPAAPPEGRIWALGPAPGGDWAGQAGRLATFLGGAWAFLDPREGWRAWGLAEAQLRVWRGTAWDQPPLDDLPGLGIGTVHDGTNRLAVAAPATLFSHAGAGHQVKVNKAAAGNTASLLFQDNWSGRAEMGLAGNDDFSVKVSADGTAWAEALRIDRTSGTVRLPAGLWLGQMPTGAVTQSATDTTAGRLLKTGDYGLGAAITLTAADHLDTLRTGGSYYNPSAGNTTGNNYPLSSAGALIVVARSSTNVIQKFISYGGTSTAAGLREFSRSYGTAGWGAWVELFHQGTLLGAVSQSGGVPTGRVIERGSNANGEYVRFADGTQICTAVAAAVETSTAAGPIYMHSNLLTWVFPASFLSAPGVSGGGGNAARWLGINAPSVGNVQYRVYSYAASGTLSAPGLTAIGRWF
jgi:hypothetical protein